jgi:hypothetical protein
MEKPAYGRAGQHEEGYFVRFGLMDMLEKCEVGHTIRISNKPMA